MMEKQMDWMMNLIPTVAGGLILMAALFSGYEPILRGYLRLVSLSTVINTFMRNTMDIFKYLMGPGG